MRGHIRRRGSRSWAIVVDLGRDLNGKRRQKWHSVKGARSDAEAELVRILHELGTGTYVEASKVTVQEFLERWLVDHAASQVSAKTLERYEQILRGHVIPALGSQRLVNLRPDQIQQFYAKSLRSGRKDGKGGLSPLTVQHFHRVLRRALQTAVRWRVLAVNPADNAEAPVATAREMTVLNEAESITLIQSLEHHRLHMPVLMALTTGMRRGEICALRWRNVDFKSKTITVTHSLEQVRRQLSFKEPKTPRSRRGIALPELLIDALRVHKKLQIENKLRLGPLWQDGDLVCAGADGQPLKPNTLSTLFASFIRRSDLKRVRFHDLRHTHATQLFLQGVHPKIVSERLGHASVAITLDRYSHVLPGMQQDAVAGFNRSFEAALRA